MERSPIFRRPWPDLHCARDPGSRWPANSSLGGHKDEVARWRMNEGSQSTACRAIAFRGAALCPTTPN
eukprot:3544022-Alexandrium_andersonii.AAC.1